MSATPVPPAAPAPGRARRVVDLIACGSIEMSVHQQADAPSMAGLLPSAARVFVNHLPRQGVEQTLGALRAAHAVGFEPVPHLSARRFPSQAMVQTLLSRAVQQAGVSKVLLLGGDDAAPHGPFADAAALLRSGLLPAAGIREVGLAAYPEGHPRITRGALEAALTEKLSLAAAQGLGAFIVTQFSFAPKRIIEHCATLARIAPSVPVYVGLVGPTRPKTLLRYARRCGVSASLQALRAQGIGAVRLVVRTDAGEQLAALERYCLANPGSNVVGIHVFSFGGAARTASWMNRMLTDPASDAGGGSGG